MNKKENNLFRQIIRAINPILLLGGISTYFLGAGIHRYTGGEISWIVFFTGLCIVVFLQMGCTLLDSYFDRKIYPADFLPINADEYLHVKELNRRVENAFLSLTISLITTGGLLTYFLVIQHLMSNISLLTLGLAFVLIILYSVPSVKLSSRGFGEFIAALLLGSIYPSFSFFLQEQDMVRLVPMITIPITTLILAAMISTSLPDYLNGLTKKKKTFLIEVGWENGLRFFNWLLLLTYAIIVVAVFTGLQPFLGRLFFIGAPLALISIYEGFRIKSGGTPHWKVIMICGIGSVGCTIYSLMFALWVG